MKALKVRDGSPLDVPLMQFAWDKEKAMHAYLGEKPKEEKDRRKEEELVAVARELFSRKRFIGYMELSEELQAAFEVKETPAQELHPLHAREGNHCEITRQPEQLHAGRGIKKEERPC